MNTKEEDLFYACMNFCNSFFHFVSEDNKCNGIKNLGLRDQETTDKIMEFEKRRFWSSFNRLKELVDDIDAEQKKYNKR